MIDDGIALGCICLVEPRRLAWNELRLCLAGDYCFLSWGMFGEWPLGNAVLKRVTVDGAPATFMLHAVHLGPMCKPEDDRTPGNRGSGQHSLSQEPPPSETQEQRVHEERGQADFNFEEGEIHGSGRRKDPSAE